MVKIGSSIISGQPFLLKWLLRAVGYFIFNKNIARIFDVQNKRRSILIVITD